MDNVREYVVENPAHPRESEGTKTAWIFGGTGVVRTVRHDGPRNIITWDYSKDRNKGA